MSTLSILCMCRFCAKEQTQKNVIDFKKYNKQRRSVEQKLNIFNEDVVDFSNKMLPETVCTECIKTLNTAYDFFLRVKQAQIVLNEAHEACQHDDVKKDQQRDPVKQEFIGLGPDNLIETDTEPGLDQSWSTYSWHCLHCSTIFLSVQELRAHRLEIHKMCYGFRCEDCYEQINRFEEFVEHAREHRPQLKDYCEFCNIKIDTETSTHTNTHANNKCTHCGELFFNKTNLQTHLNKMSQQINTIDVNNTDLINDSISSTSFGMDIDATDNQLVYQENDANEQKKCENDEEKMFDLNINYAKIESWKEYPCICKFCNRKMSQRTLMAHCTAVHGRCFAMKCIDCELDASDTVAGFVRHVGAHRPELANICYHCDCPITEPDHAQTHVGPVQCTQCGSHFQNMKEFKTHHGVLAASLQRDNKLLISVKFETNNKPVSDTSRQCLSTKESLKQCTLAPKRRGHPQQRKKDPVEDFDDETNSNICDDNKSVATNNLPQLNNKDTINDLMLDVSIEMVTGTKIEPVSQENDTDDQQNGAKDKNKEKEFDATTNYAKIESWKQYPCICKFCNKKMLTKRTLMAHCTAVHARCFAMKCIDCELDASDTVAGFVRHVGAHRPELANICHYCDSPITEPDHAQRHVGPVQCTQCGAHFQHMKEFKTHHGVLAASLLKDKKIHISKSLQTKNIICNICGKTLSTENSLRQHIRNQHESPPTPAEDLFCQICQKSFTNKHNLKCHLNVHVERTKGFYCDRCGKGYFTQNYLDVHFKTHAPRTEVCKICNKAFPSVQHLKKHVRTHNLEMPFQCDDCKKFFSTKQNLRWHVVVHLDVKPHECRYCEKRFKNKGTLRDHLRLHTGERPYSCEPCHKFFACWASCEQHMRRNHGKSLRSTVQTAHGRLDLDPATGQPSAVHLTAETRDWTANILKRLPRTRRKKEN